MSRTCTCTVKDPGMELLVQEWISEEPSLLKHEGLKVALSFTCRIVLAVSLF